MGKREPGNGWGWVKIWRQIWMSDIWKDSEPFCKRAAWIDLILLANHEPHTINTKDGPVKIKRGQLHTSVKKLATRWHWSENKVRRFIERTKRQKMVQTKRQGNGTTLTIENYTFFQNQARTDGRTNGRTNGRTDGSRTRRQEDQKKPDRAFSAPGVMNEDPPMGPPDVLPSRLETET